MKDCTKFIYRKGYDPDKEFTPLQFKTFPDYNGVQTTEGFIVYETVFSEGGSLVFCCSENF